MDPTGLMTHQTAPLPARQLLFQLKWEPNDGPRWLGRTHTKKHFRLSPGLADLLDIPLATTAGIQPTEPPTEVATMHDTLMGISQFMEMTGLSPWQVLEAIHRMVPPTIGPKRA